MMSAFMCWRWRRLRLLSRACELLQRHKYLRLVFISASLIFFIIEANYNTLNLNVWPILRQNSEDLHPFIARPFQVSKEQYFTDESLASACSELYPINRQSSINVTRQAHRKAFTLVTAYFNLGSFQKGDASLNQQYTTSVYYSWMEALGLILNDMIVFTDDRMLLHQLLRIRSTQHIARSYVCLVRRDALWAFRLVPLINMIHQQPDYPKFYPDTVLAEYGAVMHAKYSLMELSVDWNPFDARYFAWIDSGTFRDLVDLKTEYTGMKPPKLIDPQAFYLVVPSDHNASCVAMNMIESPNFSMPMLKYFHKDMVWVGGGFFLATETVMRRWIAQYQRAIFSLFEMGLSNTDQQAIYAMFHENALADRRFHPNKSDIVWVQAYRKQKEDALNEWFYLPYRCRNEWFASLHGLTCRSYSRSLNCSSFATRINCQLEFTITTCLIALLAIVAF